MVAVKGYKTLVVNGAVAVLPALDYLVNHEGIVGTVLGPNAVVVLSVLGLVNMVLRWVTTTPVLKSE